MGGEAGLLALALASCASSEPAPPPFANTVAPTATATATTTAIATATATAATPAPELAFTSMTPVDVWLRGGRVVDGTGAPPREADVVVVGERVAHVGLVDASVVAKRVIELAGRVVAPGFVDAHAHAEPSGDAKSGLAMGVTTFCIGQDGVSHQGKPVAALRAALEARPLAANFAPFVGHATVRTAAGTGGREVPRPAELAKMRALVDEGMRAGAFGLSTGLEYAPGRVAKNAELVELAKAVAAHDGVVMSHLRSEDDDAIDAALDELVEQGKAGGARVHIAHLKVVYGKGEARADALLARLAKARAEGVRVTADLYPYVASYTGIDIVFPGWAKPPASYAKAKASRLAELRAHLRARVTKRGGPGATVFGSGAYAGLTLAAAAKKKGKAYEDVLLELGPDGASAAFFVMDEALQARLLLDPFVMISTDGGGGSAHPRAFGAFARVLAVTVREKRALALEEAVRKMTGLPAETLGLVAAGRGLVRAGFFADLVVFDPARVRDAATYEKPRELAVGFDTVLVNGALARDEGAWTGKRAGRLLAHATLASKASAR